MYCDELIDMDNTASQTGEMTRAALLGSFRLPPGLGDTVPSHFLIDLYSDIRKCNQLDLASGIFTVADKTFLLILEGDHRAVLALVRQLHLEPRVMDVSVVANYPIRTLAFSEWKIHLVKAEARQHDELLATLQQLLADELALHKACDSRRLKQFFPFAADDIYPEPK